MKKTMTLAMPDRLVPMLVLSCAALAALYVGLMVTTILFATLQTQLASSIRDTQAAIADLETSYYQSIGKLDSTDPYAVGYVHPAQVVYVTMSAMPDLSFAGR